jgi:hypothetical protein
MYVPHCLRRQAAVLIRQAASGRARPFDNNARCFRNHRQLLAQLINAETARWAPPPIGYRVYPSPPPGFAMVGSGVPAIPARTWYNAHNQTVQMAQISGAQPSGAASKPKLSPSRIPEKNVSLYPYLSISTPNTPNPPVAGLRATVLLGFAVGGQQPQRAPNTPNRVEVRRRRCAEPRQMTCDPPRHPYLATKTHRLVDFWPFDSLFLHT